MSEFFSIIFSALALIISALTAYLTLLRKGTVRMTQPTQVYFGPDVPGLQKVYFRALLYSTAKRGQIVESMHVKIRRGESAQIFNIWVYGNEKLARGSGLFVGEEGVTCNHHFLLPHDGTHFEFLAGDYIVEVYATLVGQKKSLMLANIRLSLTESYATILKTKDVGVYFDWGPDSARYYASIDERPPSRQNLEDFVRLMKDKTLE